MLKTAPAFSLNKHTAAADHRALARRRSSFSNPFRRSRKAFNDTKGQIFRHPSLCSLRSARRVKRSDFLICSFASCLKLKTPKILALRRNIFNPSFIYPERWWLSLDPAYSRGIFPQAEHVPIKIVINNPKMILSYVAGRTKSYFTCVD